MPRSRSENHQEERSPLLDGFGWGTLGVACLQILTLTVLLADPTYEKIEFMRNHLPIAAGLNLSAAFSILVPPINLGQRLNALDSNGHRALRFIAGITSGSVVGYIGSAFGAALIGFALNLPR